MGLACRDDFLDGTAGRRQQHDIGAEIEASERNFSTRKPRIGSGFRAGHSFIECAVPVIMKPHIDEGAAGKAIASLARLQLQAQVAPLSSAWPVSRHGGVDDRIHRVDIGRKRRLAVRECQTQACCAKKGEQLRLLALVSIRRDAEQQRDEACRLLILQWRKVDEVGWQPVPQERSNLLHLLSDCFLHAGAVGRRIETEKGCAVQADGEGLADKAETKNALGLQPEIVGGSRRLTGSFHVMRQQRIDARKVGPVLLLVPIRDRAMQLPALTKEHKLVRDIAHDPVTERVTVQFVDVLRLKHSFPLVYRQMLAHCGQLGLGGGVDLNDKRSRKTKAGRACDFQCHLAFEVESIDATRHCGVDRIRQGQAFSGCRL